MKNALILALVSLASVNAFAAPVSAPLTKINVDPRAFGTARFGAGSMISVDVAAREATLTLAYVRVCVPGTICSKIIRAPLQMTLPLVSRKTDQCNAVVYTAVSDQRRTTGILSTLVIRDNSTSHCTSTTGEVIAPLEIEYITEGSTASGNANSTSTFTADSLRSVQSQ